MEVRAALKALKKNKVPGLDGLPPLVFKMFHDQLVTFATALFIKLLEQEAKYGAQVQSSPYQRKVTGNALAITGELHCFQ